MSVKWSDYTQSFPFVTGLIGCTTVVIIGEGGCWVSHHWESPSFLNEENLFQDQVITPINNGDGDRMPSPFASTGDGQSLASGTNIQIFISTPKNPDDGAFLYDEKINKIVSTLTGDGKAFAGATVTKRGYVKQQPDRFRARGKVLIQYDNDQVDDEDNPPARQQAIYRVWFEDEMVGERRWDTADAQKRCGSSPGNRKRQNGGVCSLSGTNTAATGANTGTATGINTAAATSTRTDTNTGAEAPSSTSGGSPIPSNDTTSGSDQTTQPIPTSSSAPDPPESVPADPSGSAPDSMTDDSSQSNAMKDGSSQSDSITDSSQSKAMKDDLSQSKSLTDSSQSKAIPA